MKISLTLFTFVLFSFAYGQKNEIGVIPFKLEKTAETWTQAFEPKLTGGLYYNRYFERFHWSTEFIIEKNSINDYCESCNPSAAGTGAYKELSIATGLGIRLHGEKHSGLTGNLRFLIYGGLTGYSGTFLGAYSAWYFDYDQRFYLLGGQLQYSLSYTLKSGFLFGLDVALKQSKTWARVGSILSTSSYIPPFMTMTTLPSIRVGYQF
ncbi:MAG: hypothetical protein GQ574_11725 [Crocinitomix sp.]|nr:hypothetical protein [Crocinitomix sp.]